MTCLLAERWEAPWLPSAFLNADKQLSVITIVYYVLTGRALSGRLTASNNCYFFSLRACRPSVGRPLDCLRQLH